MEKKGEVNGILIFDDYAHHPAEIFATLHAVKHAIGHRRLVVAFQPHRFTRTRDCMAEFGPALEPASSVILTDIYAAGESPLEGVTTDALYTKISDSSSVELHCVPRGELLNFVAHFLQPQDVFLTMGAGDITKLGPEILQKLSSLHAE